MSHLLLTDDEVALLRWTCELFFVEESPVFFLESEAREPRDFATTYAELLKKGVLDDARFRLTDMALNRLAPLTECDARVVMTLPGDRPGKPRTRDFYLLDEIGVEYEEVDGAHSVGGDQDHAEFVQGLVRRFMPRRASGDFLNFKATPAEFLTLSVLCHRARQGNQAVPADVLVGELRPALHDGRADTLSPARKRNRDSVQDNAALKHRAASILAAAPQDPSPAVDVTARSNQPVAAESTQLMRPRPAATARLAHAAALEEVDTVVQPRNKRGKSNPPQDADMAEAALAGLVQKGLVLTTQAGIELRPAVRALALGLTERNRHTFVRFDFADDEWFVRETSFLALEGSLFGLTADPADGLIQVTELDGRRLEAWLSRAVGPMPEGDESTAKSAKDLMLRA